MQNLFLTNFRPVPLTEYAVFQRTVFRKRTSAELHLARQAAQQETHTSQLALQGVQQGAGQALEGGQAQHMQQAQQGAQQGLGQGIQQGAGQGAHASQQGARRGEVQGTQQLLAGQATGMEVDGVQATLEPGVAASLSPPEPHLSGGAQGGGPWLMIRVGLGLGGKATQSLCFFTCLLNQSLHPFMNHSNVHLFLNCQLWSQSNCSSFTIFYNPACMATGCYPTLTDALNLSPIPHQFANS